MIDSIDSQLDQIEDSIKDKKERAYFWTHQARYFFILREIGRIAKKRKLKILDIGCFPYHIGFALEKIGHDVYGISSQHEPMRNKKIKVLNIEKDTFPYKNNFFDFVLCSEVIEHLPQTPVFPLKEMLRVTKKGGHLLVSTPNIARSINRAKILVGLSPMYPTDVYFEENGKGNTIYHRHNREYTLSELQSVVKKTGWNIKESGYFISYTPFRKREIPDSVLFKIGKFANYLLMKSIPTLRDTLFVLGKK